MKLRRPSLTEVKLYAFIILAMATGVKGLFFDASWASLGCIAIAVLCLSRSQEVAATKEDLELLEQGLKEVKDRVGAMSVQSGIRKARGE